MVQAFSSSWRPRALLCVGLAAGLAGCGGGGGGDGPAASAFPKISDLSKPGTLTLDGFSRETVMTETAAGTVAVSAFSGVGASSIEIALDRNDAPTQIKLTTPGLSETWTAGAPGTTLVKNDVLYSGVRDGNLRAVQITAPDALEYQRFGAWSVLAGDQGWIGAGSFGHRTAAANLPSTGTARYAGAVTGLYVDGDAKSGVLIAEATVDANFAARLLTFSTTDTQLVAEAATTPAARLNVSPTELRPTTGDARHFSGVGWTRNSALSGMIDARFYGPNAEEVGGTLALRGAGTELIAGGFGAKKR